MLGKSVKEDKEGDSLEVLQQCKTPSLGNSTEQGSTLRDLLTSTAGKLKLGSTDAGIAFAPVYSTASQVHRDMAMSCVATRGRCGGTCIYVACKVYRHSVIIPES